MGKSTYVRFRTITGILLLLLAALLLSGCAWPKANHFIPQSVNLERQHPYTVKIETLGGKKTQFGGLDQVEPGMFEEALKASIEQTKAFSAVVYSGADYHLDVTLYEVKGTGFIPFEITLFANWKLSDPLSGAIEFQRQIKGVHSSSNIAGGIRATRAAEGAARNNIAEGLRQISMLHLAK